MNIAATLQHQAARVPERVALIDLTAGSARTLTFRQLEHAAARAAEALLRDGLTPGSRVMVIHPVNARLYVALAAMFRAGLVPVVCDPGMGRRRFVRACAAVSPNAIFASAAGHLFAATIPALAAVPYRFSYGRFPGSIDISRRSGTLDIVRRRGDDPALITFTSGSTAEPKALVRTHAILRAQLDAIRAVIPTEGVDIATMPIPLLANLGSGVTSVIPSADLRRPAQVDPRRLARAVEFTHATGMVASPALLDALLRADPRRLGSLRRIVTGGGPVMPSLVSALRATLPNVEILSVYGSSEAEPIACLAWTAVSDADVRAMRDGAGLLAGSPAPGSSIGNRDGEIIVAGDHVVPGYLDAGGDAETKLQLGGRTWHRTGDGGYVDAIGRIWLTGRRSAQIRDDRGMMEPFRVECALSFDGGIRRSALIGNRSKRWLFVEPRSGSALDARSIRRAVPWAHVDEIRSVRHLPVDRRHNAKIDYPALLRMIR